MSICLENGRYTRHKRLEKLLFKVVLAVAQPNICQFRILGILGNNCKVYYKTFLML